MPDLERIKLTTEMIESDSDVAYAITALQSLGITTAEQAADQWGITTISRGDWEKTKGTASIHLFPWGEKKDGGRNDKAWFMVDFGRDGSHWVTCKRDSGVTTDHITVSSERVVAPGVYPKRWETINFYNQAVSTSVRFDSNGNIIYVGNHGNDSFFDIHHNRVGDAGIDKALAIVGNSLRLGPEIMPGRTTFNPGLLVNTILKQEQPFDIPQMIATART